MKEPMPLNEEEFTETFNYALDTIIASMAETPEIEPARFYDMVCIIENLQFFSPVIYGALKFKEPEA